MKGTLIVLEGIDGSGKATQTTLLKKSLEEEGRNVLQISFPDYDSESSALVKMYLNGKFGTNPSDVNPYAASLFYALDRFASYRTKWKDFYESGGIVLADRYTTSNMVHQMTKYNETKERSQFLDWLERTEYVELEIPRPDEVILLDVPLAITKKLVKARATEGRILDIHEKHVSYLRQCHNAYQELCTRYSWKKVACTKNNKLRPTEDIAEEVRAIATFVLS